MLAAGAEYLAYEAMARGAMPVVRASFLPFYQSNGIDANINSGECNFVPPDRIQFHYHGLDGGCITDVMEAKMQVASTPVSVAWDYNYPGYDVTLYFRTSSEAFALFDSSPSYVAVNQGDTLDLQAYYQFALIIFGYRAWAVDAIGDADTFSAYAVDSDSDTYKSYAAHEHVPGDRFSYIENLEVVGEFVTIQDIEQAGSVSMEVPVDFGDLVAGSHSGLLLTNRQGSFVGDVWTPAPAYSPNMASFFLADQPDWQQIMLKIELGWDKSGYFRAGFLEDEWLSDSYTDFVTLFLGRVKKWGPINRAVDEGGMAQPNTVEVYAEDFIADCLNRRIALPSEDGTPNPVIFGEFLKDAEPIAGWHPGTPIKTAVFEDGNFNELDGTGISGGGGLSVITPGLTQEWALRSVVSGASQSAYGKWSVQTSGEMFVTGSIRFTSIPSTIGNLQTSFLSSVDSVGAVADLLAVNSEGYFQGIGGTSNFNIVEYEGVPLSFALWFSPQTVGHSRLWINGDEILSYQGDLTGHVAQTIRFGCVTGGGGAGEEWTVDYDDLKIFSEYFSNAYQVYGGPFVSIGAVYLDDRGQPASKTIGAYTQTLTRHANFGMVQFTSTDPEFEVSGDVKMRVVENMGGRHPLEVIELLLYMAGLTDYIDATALAAAYLATPNDIINCCFEGGGDRNRWGLKDVSSMGMTIGDAIREICSRCLYLVFTDAGSIKIVPYTGIHPTDAAVLALTASNKWENSQTFDLDNIKDYVTAVYGWYAHNPSLFYVAGDMTAGGDGVGLDYSWESPVASESLTMVKTKADLLYQFLSANERVDPVRTNLIGARVEGMDIVSITDPLLHSGAKKYWVSGKEVSLDRGSFETNLQLIRYLGDT